MTNAVAKVGSKDWIGVEKGVESHNMTQKTRMMSSSSYLSLVDMLARPGRNVVGLLGDKRTRKRVG